MNKLCGILPYLYFFDKPIHLGSITLLSVPDTQGRDYAPKEEIDKHYLQELIKCFPVSCGLQSDKGVIRAFTYFLVDNSVKDNEHVLGQARKAITLLRYMMLRPDSQGLNDLETSVVYAFELPPSGNEKTHTYHGWVNFNQEEWLTPTHQKFYPPSWHVNFQMEHTSNLEDLESIKHQFYNNVLDERTEANIILAMAWYNLSFEKYAFGGIEGRLIDISVAFDTLFRLQENKTKLFDCVNHTLNVTAGTPIERWSRDFYGKVRSATMHFGKPATLLFKHQETSEGHISFLWSAQRIFRECVAAKVGLNRKTSNDHLIEELTPNDVTLKRLRALGSYEEIRNKGQLELWKLRQIYPVGEKEDIVWLGKTLLSEMANQTSVNNLPALSSAIDLILSSDSDDENLWSKYVQLDSELNRILFRGNVEQAKYLSPCMALAYDVSKFAGFAWYALQTLTYSKK